MSVVNYLKNQSYVSHPVSRETIKVMNNGFYTNSKDEVKSIQESLQKSIENCLLFKPDFEYKHPETKVGEGVIEVVAEDIISCSYRLVVTEKRSNCVILNFANGVHPGGGWAHYAMAQEECIMRASGGYASMIAKQEFYQSNSHNSALSTDSLIYSPDVPFFRNSKNKFLEEPFSISMITSPAVIAAACHLSQKKIREIMEKRCRKIIQCAINQKDKVIALGAFGCGAFRNDPNVIAGIFKQILIDEDYKSYFDYIVFPIPEYHGNVRSFNIDPFSKILNVPIRKIEESDEFLEKK